MMDEYSKIMWDLVNLKPIWYAPLQTNSHVVEWMIFCTSTSKFTCSWMNVFDYKPFQLFQDNNIIYAPLTTIKLEEL